MAGSNFTSLVEALQARAAASPDEEALRLIGPDLVRQESYSVAQLSDRAKEIAAALQERVGPGERVILMLSSGLDYCAAFYGCLYAGVVAVPAYPPEMNRVQHQLRLRSILVDAAPALILTQRAAQEAVLAAFPGQPVAAVEDMPAGTSSAWRPMPSAPDSLAFLQYTSGSTSRPKGVCVSHGNLVTNENLIRHAFNIDETDVILSWLPLFHDMGLIGGMLQPVFAGARCILMAPQTFLERPVRWLRAISEYGATFSGGPDFAYRLCSERIRPSSMEGIDLSRWRLAFTGSEPVRFDTMDIFARTFAAAGFDPASIFAGYGLAEATLYVSGGHWHEGESYRDVDGAALSAGAVVAGKDRRLTNCGAVPPGCGLRIVDPATSSSRQEGQVGEIWVSGDSVAQGYWRNPTATEQAFVRNEGQTWLRTGDLGVIIEGLLYVTGRLKDMIILRGQNIYPQDLEQAVESQVAAVRKGRVAVFAVDQEGREAVGVAAEVARGTQRRVPAEQLRDEISRAIVEVCQEAPAVVALLNPGALPKTSSGKLQRSACRQAIEGGTIDCYRLYLPEEDGEGGEAPASETERLLAELWSDLLNVEAPGRQENFFALGGNSVTAVQLHARLCLRLKTQIELEPLFRAATLAETAALLDAAGGRSLTRASGAIEPIRPTAQATGPLSPSQRRMWFQWKLNPAGYAYNIQAVVRLSGKLDRRALHDAVAGLAERHQVLRSVFTEIDGLPVQQVQEAARISVIEEDLSGPANGDVEREVARRADAEARKPFDLSTGPMMRLKHLVLGDESDVLILTVHHCAADGWSMNLLVNDFSALYRACAAGEQVALPALPIQYLDYARWQRSWLKGDAATAALAYWFAKLGDGEAATDLPADRRRTPETTLAGATLVCPLEEPLTRAVGRLARRLGVTVPSVLLASFKALLFRYTGATDLQIGTTIANRTRPETERMVGSFVNMLVLRSSPTPGLPFADYVRQVRDVAVAAQTHQELPFEALVEALHPNRQAGSNPLFHIVFDHQWREFGDLNHLEGLAVESIEQSQIATQFDLILHTAEQEGRLEAAFTYASDMFDPGTIEQISRHWLTLLEAAVRNPEGPIGQIPIISADERQVLLATWNRHAATPSAPVQSCLHERFADCARRYGNAVAVTCDAEEVTYEALNRRANRIAWRLREVGVGPDDLVGLAANRSIDLIVGLLGILKAGGAYLPLDPAYPEDRLAYMQADAGTSVLLTGPDLSRDVPAEEGVTVIPLTAEAFPDRPEDDPPSVTSPENLAYSIYTSGSTGKPKGVGITHANVLRLFRAGDRHFDFGPQDVWTMFHSYAFDFSVWEIFGALLYGGRLVVVPYSCSRSPAEFHALVAEQGVTVLNQTPSAFRDFAREAVTARGEGLALRYVVFGGEALDVAALTPWFDRFGDDRPTLTNMYGITETTVHVTFKAVTRKEAAVGGSPIGEPLEDLAWYCLGDGLEPVPAGVVGELHIGGAGLARGYLKRPELTAQRFIPDPFDATGGGRLYRTGDLAVRAADGRVTYLGRSDNQVKIRGFRIELGEIEEALRRQPELKDAAIVVQKDRLGDSQLIAYAAVDAERLRSPHEKEQSEPLGHWEAVFDDTYGSEEAGSGPSFTGWNDSYADAPLPQAHMQEWLDTTVKRIQSLGPRHVLEVGCGVGLLTQHLAPAVRSYRGTDLSARAIADLQAWIEGRPEFENTLLICQDALDFSGIESGLYDTVILNSVVAYFPSAGYLVDVLRGLCALAKPGGRIFIGDVRQLDLHWPFRASVELARAKPKLRLAALRAQVDSSQAEDGELLLSPLFFHALSAAGLPIADVRVHLRRGSHDNEMTRYRYDVVLTVGPAAEGANAPCPVWSGEGVGLSELERRLRQERPPRVYLRGFANRRVAEDIAAAEALNSWDPAADVDSLRRELAKRTSDAVDPEQLWRLAESLGYRARLTWAADRDPARFDAILQGPATEDVADSVPDTLGAWSDYANDPQGAQRRRALPAHLRERLKATLPAHMVPARIHVVDAMPLTANGKLDRKALALAHPTGGRLQGIYLPPESAAERVLASIWEDVLAVERVGRRDNFFDLGGHSLLATQVIARIEQRLQVRTSLRDLFEAQDLATFAARIDRQRDAEGRMDRAAGDLEELAESLRGLEESEIDRLLERTEGAL